jgi:hypothetical protein
MRKLLAVAAAALLFPMVAAAEVSIGASLGYAIPMGDAVKDGPMTDVIKGGVPIEVNVTYGLTKEVEVGVYAGYEFGFLASDAKDGCDASGVDCSIYGWRLGLEGEYLLSHEAIAPFVGANVGLAWETLKESASGDWAKLTERGWELGVKAGADMKLSEQLKVGAFIGFAIGQYTNESQKCSSSSICSDDSVSIPSSDRAMHEWLTIGVRGAFGL